MERGSKVDKEILDKIRVLLEPVLGLVLVSLLGVRREYLWSSSGITVSLFAAHSV